MDIRRYLVGNAIYRGASNAPTRGTVDPMGYINRSLGMSPVGGDGLSDKRSGLAQAAMARLRGMSQQPPDVNAPIFGGTPYRINQPIDPPPMQHRFGHMVSATGQLLPISPTPEQTTLQNMYGQPQEGGPSESQMMQAARDRLAHRLQTKEMLTKHQIQMQRMTMQHAEHINKHRGNAYA